MRPAVATLGASTAPPVVVPASSVEVTAQLVQTEPFTLCAADVRPLPLSGIEIFGSDLPSVGDNIVFSAKHSAKKAALESVLIDAAAGRRLAAVGGVYDGDARLQRAVVSTAGSKVQELLDLNDGSRVRPRITTPDGAPQLWRIGLDGRSGLVWLLARTRRNTAYFGIWPEPRSAPVSLDQALPFWPETMNDDSGVLVSNAERSCLLEREGVRCFPATAYAKVLEGRYVVGSLGSSIHDTQSGQELAINEDCSWRVAATLESPPRALFACNQAGEVRWAVWSPEGSTILWTSGDWLTPQTSISGRVVPLELLVRPDAVVNHWFDLLRQRVIVTPPLVPLEPQQHFGAGIVVESDEEKASVFWLDIEAATLTPLVPEIDCEQQLQWQAASDQHVLVACPKPTMAEHRFLPASRPSHYEWLELIDLQARRRLRTDQMFEAELTESGIAVGIKPGAPSSLAALQPPATCSAALPALR